MRIYVAALLTALLMVGLALPVSADDFIVTTQKWADLSKDRQDEVIKELTRKGVLRPGKDRLIYRPFGANQPDVTRSQVVDALICQVCRCC